VDEETKKRIALNEATYRKINEGMRAEPANAHIAFVCECGLLGCNQLIRLTRTQYEAVRSHPRRFAIVPGHDIAEVESVVEQHDDFAVIEKLADASDVAEHTDPRRALDD